LNIFLVAKILIYKTM